MSEALIDSLSAPQRLALAYAPKGAKPATLALFALDARLGQAVRQASEPIMGQVRLAWWRDQLRLDPAVRARTDELICALDAFAGQEGELGFLVDGWEELLAEELNIAAYAEGRGAGFAALARALGHSDIADDALAAGKAYALADLAANMANSDERQAVLDTVSADADSATLPRDLRSIVVLGGLARRSFSRGGAPLLDGPGAIITAIRLGLTGR